MAASSQSAKRSGAGCFVVLLRGVNVGKGNRVPMAAFKSLLEALGYTDVRTLLNSGNAVFSADGRAAATHADAIAAALRDHLGIDVLVIVKTAREFLDVLDEAPLTPPAGEHSCFVIAWTQAPEALQGIAPLVQLARPPERFVVGANAAYLYCPAGLLANKAAAALLGKAGRSVTTRNWATAIKLGALLRPKTV